jgi:hypothetical protein
LAGAALFGMSAAMTAVTCAATTPTAPNIFNQLTTTVPFQRIHSALA